MKGNSSFIIQETNVKGLDTLTVDCGQDLELPYIHLFNPGEVSSKATGSSKVAGSLNVERSNQLSGNHSSGQHHSGHQIDWVIRGQVTFLVDQKTVQLSAGEMLWSHMGERPRLIAGDSAASILRISMPLFYALELRLCKGFELELLLGTIFRLSVSDQSDIQKLQRQMADLMGDDPALREIAAEEFRLYLRRLSQYGETPPEISRARSTSGRACHHVYRMLSYINENYRDDLTIDKIANHLGLHRNFTMSLFKRVMGMSLLECITGLRIRYAEKLLINTNEDVTSIAFDSGFSSLTRFYEVFGKHFGESPQRYRNRMWMQSR
ncbi:hypothetical protein BTA51_26475 [Hahella sp. CCB-MM4]|uniref:helix-turn-helix domain-containing protein n=1 Tax=Hahella sp. (strain CCB-MM4) TaxID=1926491 RepID=UPI000B9A5787|nr:helix-turn-helix domain-containing protein [Hahella sp. CCB-MM4]OZG70388.1 hypothetical protein BTA51_26475 [Hahella sp. CCB-MM4]